APHLGFWQVHYASIGSNAFCVGTGGGKVMGTTGNVAMLEKIQPEVLIGMPTFVYHMLQEAAESGVSCKPLRLIVLGGEKAPEGMRNKLRALAAELGAGRVNVLVTYGFTEAKQAKITVPASSVSR
ncbi:MAG: AMP-binding protein, partial [Bacteroidota bacterium]